MIEMLNCDCMDYMRVLPDKAFELAIVDPPYGININMNIGLKKEQAKKREQKKWDNSAPDDRYFKELFRVSKNQVIWGGNYFLLPPARCFVVWDKGETMYGRSFAECEFAWTSFDESARIFKITPIDANRFHPTQKPIALYKWLLSRYAKPGDRILDTHGGSGSICIACHDLGYDLTWMELDKDYYEAACKRYKDHAAQAVLFDPQEITRKTYNNEFDLTS